MSPAAVLAVYQQIGELALPRTDLLSIRGYQFALGDGISSQAQENLQQAVVFLRNMLGSR